MSQNKVQKAAAERAKKAANPEVAVEQPKQEAPASTPAPAAVAAPAQPNKQQATLDKLKAAWTEKKVDLSKLTVKQDGKYLLAVVAEGWPTVQVGSTGGITVVELKSYQSAFDAAVDGLALYEKQKARDAKKATATASKAPAPAQQTA
jgi:16S rRNA U1498 N3-methylase RsmE